MIVDNQNEPWKSALLEAKAHSAFGSDVRRITES